MSLNGVPTLFEQSDFHVPRALVHQFHRRMKTQCSACDFVSEPAPFKLIQLTIQQAGATHRSLGHLP